MPTPTTAELLKYADLQMAAEAFLVQDELTGLLKTGETLMQALIDGNNHASKFTETQATAFLDLNEGWTVLAQKPNTTTGFSGTLFRNNKTKELVISMRSTEFVDDAARDNQATNSMEIKEKGWAFGQIDDMEKWYAEIKTQYAADFATAGNKFALTGYSLGGHLATAFDLLRRDDTSRLGTPNPVTATYTFNGAGVGQVNAATNLSDVMTTFRTAREGGSAALFTTTLAQQIYNDLRTRINGQASSADMSSAILDVISAKDNPIAGSQTKAELNLLLDALVRTKLVRDEIDRVAGITNTGPNDKPVQVTTDKIDAVKLDYQLAVMIASQSTSPWRTDLPSLIADAANNARTKIHYEDAMRIQTVAHPRRKAVATKYIASCARQISARARFNAKKQEIHLC
jgi:hypothetical protein